jgi:hypothetical protein
MLGLSSATKIRTAKEALRKLPGIKCLMHYHFDMYDKGPTIRVRP